MPHQRRAELADLHTLWDLRTRAIRASCATHYPTNIIDAWCAAPPPDKLAPLLQAGGGLVDLSSSLNAVPVYERAGYVALRREIYPHRSGLQLESVYMEKMLP